MDAYGHALRDVEGAVSTFVSQLRPLDLEDARLGGEDLSHELLAHAPDLRQLNCLVMSLKCPHDQCPGDRSLVTRAKSEGVVPAEPSIAGILNFANGIIYLPR